MTRYVAGARDAAPPSERFAQHAAVLRMMARSCDATAEQVARQVGELREAKVVIGSSWGGLRRNAAIHRSRDHRREAGGGPEQFAIAAAILRDWANNADALADLLPPDADESVDVIAVREDVAWRWTAACNAATANLSPVIRQLTTVSTVEIRRASHVDNPCRQGWRALQSSIDGLERWISRNPDEAVSYWWRRSPPVVAVPFVQHGPRRVTFQRAPLAELTLSAAPAVSFASSKGDWSSPPQRRRPAGGARCRERRTEPRRRPRPTTPHDDSSGARRRRVAVIQCGCRSGSCISGLAASKMPDMTDDASRGMTRRVVIACRTCRVGWTEGAVAACSDLGHEHSRYERHRHRTPVSLPSGTEVWAVSFEEDDPYSRDVPPQFGVYLDEKWGPPWEHAHLPWPDFGVPSDDDALRQLLGDALLRAKAGERVEIGCWGAHGRTGTAIGCLAILDGHAASDAVAWVRTNYCERAIETPEQEAFVAAFTRERDGAASSRRSGRRGNHR